MEDSTGSGRDEARLEGEVGFSRPFTGDEYATSKTGPEISTEMRRQPSHA